MWLGSCDVELDERAGAVGRELAGAPRTARRAGHGRRRSLTAAGPRTSAPELTSTQPAPARHSPSSGCGEHPGGCVSARPGPRAGSEAGWEA